MTNLTGTWYQAVLEARSVAQCLMASRAEPFQATLHAKDPSNIQEVAAFAGVNGAVSSICCNLYQEFSVHTPSLVSRIVDPQYRRLPAGGSAGNTPLAKPRIAVWAHINQRRTLEVFWTPLSYKPEVDGASGLQLTDFVRVPWVRNQHLLASNIVARFLERDWLHPEFKARLTSEQVAQCRETIFETLAFCLDNFLTTVQSVADVDVIDWPILNPRAVTYSLESAESRASDAIHERHKTLKAETDAQVSILNDLLNRAGLTSLDEYRTYQREKGALPLSRYMFEKRGTRISSLQLDKLDKQILKVTPLQVALASVTSTLAEATQWLATCG